MPDGPAATLDELHLTLRPEPLTTPEEFQKYYRPQVNKVRGEDTVARLSLKLRQAYRALPFKAFLMGHPGVGKSTEITRLLDGVSERYASVRLSVATELNPASFKVFDVLILMMARLAEEAGQLRTIPLPTSDTERLASGIERWFGTEEVKKIRTRSAGGEAETGAGVKGDSLWAGILGILASAKLEMKYSAERKTETVDYSLRRLPELARS